MSRYIDLEDYVCDGCRNDYRCGGCPSNDDRIAEWNQKYGDNGSRMIETRRGYGLNITD